MNEIAEDTRLATVVQFLREIEFDHSPPSTWTDKDGDEIFGIDSANTMSNGRFKVHIYGEEKRNLVLFYCYFYTNAPPRKRQEMAEFISRVNLNLCNGNFEMDFFDGEVRYKTCLLYDGVPLSFDGMRAHLDACLRMMDRCAPWIESVIISEYNPAQAVELLRQPPKPVE